MKAKTLKRGVLGVMALIAVAVVAAASDAIAASPTVMSTASGDGVVPVVLTGNVSCADLNDDDADFPSILSDAGLKIEPVVNGTYSITNGSGRSLTGGALSDPSNSITIANSNGTYFDWSATLGIRAVIVKGGATSNTYVYVPEDFADTNLHSPMNPTNGNPFGLSHVEFCFSYSLTASKTADVTYTRTHEWTIEKTVDPASHVGFAGDDFSSTYTVSIGETTVDSDFAVVGDIEVTNPTPYTVGFTVTDSLDSTAAAVSCPSSSLAPGASVTCTYSIDLGGDPDGSTNTATITSSNPVVDGTTATADVVTGEPTTEVDPSVSVNDVHPYPDGTETSLGTVSDTTLFTFVHDFACSTDDDDYTDGTYSEVVDDRATIVDTGAYDDAAVEVTCYLPSATKTAVGSYTSTHTWMVDKTVDPTSQSGGPGDELDWTWTVTASETTVASDHIVIGTIDVVNPNPSSSIEVTVTDELSDGTVAAVDCDDATEGDQSTVVVPAGSTITCTYAASPDDDSATSNTATVAYGSAFSVQTTTAVSFEATVVGGTATLIDDELGLEETLAAGGGTWTFTGSGDGHTCSTLWSAYGSDGTYEGSQTNTADLVATGGQTESASATTTYTCEAGSVQVQKTFDGAVDSSLEVYFNLYGGPEGYGASALASVTSLGDADGIMSFGPGAPSLDEAYTVCELAVPAGVEAVWTIGSVELTAYNPDAAMMEDYGNRCVEIGAGTDHPIVLGTTLSVTIDNVTSSGGSPRTPGYWMNWSTFGKGNQVATAGRNGGYENGFWLLDDALNTGITGGITWDDILSDSFLVPLDDIEQAVEILDMRVVTSNGVIDGRKLASDPARRLARNLLAAQVNVLVGNCTTPEVMAAIVQGETLLDKLNFDGTKTTAYLTNKSGADSDTAKTLAALLDLYNNGYFCAE